jgi:hypothetical protein
VGRDREEGEERRIEWKGRGEIGRKVRRGRVDREEGEKREDLDYKKTKATRYRSGISGSDFSAAKTLPRPIPRYFFLSSFPSSPVPPSPSSPYCPLSLFSLFPLSLFPLLPSFLLLPLPSWLALLILFQIANYSSGLETGSTPSCSNS